MSGARGVMDPHELAIDTPVGELRLVAANGALTRVGFAASGSGREATPSKANTILTLAKRQLHEYFSGKRREFELPLAPEGTEFQRAVWTALLDIAFGATTTYGEIARRIGRPAAVRAVGAANGANPIPIIIPCHRVIGSDGSLTGYGGGIENKRFLLRLEGAEPVAGEGQRPLFDE